MKDDFKRLLQKAGINIGKLPTIEVVDISHWKNDRREKMMEKLFEIKRF